MAHLLFDELRAAVEPRVVQPVVVPPEPAALARGTVVRRQTVVLAQVHVHRVLEREGERLGEVRRHDGVACELVVLQQVEGLRAESVRAR